MMIYMTPDTRIPPYIIFPRFLLDTALSETARLLYVILFDRARISQKNADWTDREGRVYLIFPIKSLAQAIHKSEMTVKNALSDLEKQDLIERKRQGPGLPNKIYVKLPSDNTSLTSWSENHPAASSACNGQNSVGQIPVHSQDNKLSSPQTEINPSKGQHPVCPTDKNLSGNKNKVINKLESDTERKNALSAYGYFHNVLLSESDIQMLKKEIPDWQAYIDRLSRYMASSGKTYANHAATILKWAQQDNAVRTARSYTCREGESL